jgi:crossover junction endodeoxyribonuclease RuvC
LGIDPGSIKTGYALITKKNNGFEVLCSGTIYFSKSENFNEKLTFIFKEFSKLIRGLKVDQVAFESLVYVKNPSSLIKLSQTRGALISALESMIPNIGKNIYEYSPNLIKSTVTGHGHASKESIQKMVQMLTGVKSFKTDDESDALAIAICHLMHHSFTSKINQNTMNNSRKLKKVSRGNNSIGAALSHRIQKN